jgi:hypothetical protein
MSRINDLDRMGILLFDFHIVGAARVVAFARTMVGAF